MFDVNCHSIVLRGNFKATAKFSWVGEGGNCQTPVSSSKFLGGETFDINFLTNQFRETIVTDSQILWLFVMTLLKPNNSLINLRSKIIHNKNPVRKQNNIED